MKCNWCNGTGKNGAAYGPVPCPDCDGSGELMPPACPVCGDAIEDEGAECEACINNGEKGDE